MQHISKMKYTAFRSFFIACFIAVRALTADAQETEEYGGNIFGILQQFDPLVIVVETDLQQLKSEREEIAWQPGVFKVMVGDSVALQREVKIKPRGNMRRKTCDFPPVKIKFPTGQPKNDSLSEMHELKVVATCDEVPQFEQYVVKECLVYELYQILTDESFRVKSATIIFRDSNKKRNDVEGYSFFIESVEELAARLKGKPYKARLMSTVGLDSAAYDRMTVFQFMIGNLDWEPRNRHNIKIIVQRNRKPVVVPYDFDYAGIINASYAIPDPQLPVNSVGERYFLGMCRDSAAYQPTFDLFLSKKEELFKRIEEFPRLTKSSRKEMRVYLEEFYAILEDPEKSRTEIVEHCGKQRTRKQ